MLHDVLHSQHLVYLACFLAIGYTFLANQSAINKIDAESMERRDQNCLTFETAHLEEVRDLTKAYAYLAALQPDEKKATLNKFIIAQLPEQETDAKNDFDDHGVLVPAYCDQPGMGRPEPDPVVPARPLGL